MIGSGGSWVVVGAIVVVVVVVVDEVSIEVSGGSVVDRSEPSEALHAAMTRASVRMLMVIREERTDCDVSPNRGLSNGRIPER